MKFLLVMYACSAIAGYCGNPVKDPLLYDSHKECAISGYNKSIEVLNALEKEDVNSSRLYFAFNCTEQTFS